MTGGKTTEEVDFGALRRAIEGGAPDTMLGFYADDARVRVLNGGAPPFEIRGKTEIRAYLRAVFGRPANHRVEYEVVGHKRVTFEDVCEYPDGARVVVATTLEVGGGKISRQVDAVMLDGRSGHAGSDDPVAARSETLYGGAEREAER